MTKKYLPPYCILLERIIHLIFIFSKSSQLGPDFKVLYLARDPRASVNSLLQSPSLQEGQDFQNTSLFCDRLYNDIVAAEIILRTKNLRPRFKVVKYEDILSQPKQVISSLFEFVGAKKEYLRNAFQYIDDHQANAQDLSKYYTIANHTSYFKTRKAIHGNDTNSPEEKLRSTGYVEQRKILTMASQFLKKNLMAYIARFKHQVRNDENFKKFSHNHWQYELPKDYLYAIQHQKTCTHAMKILEYI